MGRGGAISDGSPAATLRCKLGVVGDAAVGKTSLVQMYESRGGRFPKNYKLTGGVDLVVAPTAVGESAENPEVKEAVVELYIFDTGGHHLFRDQGARNLAECNAVMAVFDLTRRETMDDALSQAKALAKGGSKPAHGVLVGTKSDAQDRRAVDPDEGMMAAQQLGWAYFEASAMPPAKGVEDPFLHVANEFWKAYEDKLKAFESAA
mmetsp:Transcript_16664/g.56827  ORF Transcript_16664/g.56827 Transcript_16664/m.56827 type:complete len:206 (-) Transcript_16664:1573-2190(-)